jgi:hypothetical protein
MGFCFFNNAAVAARAARAAGAKRVLVLDWDVHHGNGTQVKARRATRGAGQLPVLGRAGCRALCGFRGAAFGCPTPAKTPVRARPTASLHTATLSLLCAPCRAHAQPHTMTAVLPPKPNDAAPPNPNLLPTPRPPPPHHAPHPTSPQHIFEEAPDVMYMSLHRWDGGAFYPGTGAATEVGWGEGRGFNINVAWDGPGATDGDYALAMRALLLPIARAYAPSLVIISAGFDAAAGDPIGGCRLTPAAFAGMTRDLMVVAPVALLLEGGYNLSATAVATEACVRVLLGGPRACDACGGEADSTYGSAGVPGRDVTLAGWRGVCAAAAAQARFWPCTAPAASAAPPPAVAALLQREEELEAARRAAAAAREARLREELARQRAAGASPPLPPPSAAPGVCGRGASRSREPTPSEERPWSSRFRRPSFSVAHEARLHMARAGLSRKQQLLRHLHRRALRLALKRRSAAAKRQARAAAVAEAAGATGADAHAGGDSDMAPAVQPPLPPPRGLAGSSLDL